MPADWCTVNLLILPNIADITTAATEPIAPGYYSVLPILLSITNITQYYKYNVHQYYPVLHYQY